MEEPLPYRFEGLTRSSLYNYKTSDVIQWFPNVFAEDPKETFDISLGSKLLKIAEVF